MSAGRNSRDQDELKDWQALARTKNHFDLMPHGPTRINESYRRFPTAIYCFASMPANLSDLEGRDAVIFTSAKPGPQALNWQENEGVRPKLRSKVLQLNPRTEK